MLKLKFIIYSVTIKMEKQDLTISEIKEHLKKKGLTLYSVSKSANLNQSACYIATRTPHYRGEVAIINALGLPPQEIWPSRYDNVGNRTSRTHNQQIQYSMIAPLSHDKNTKVV